MCWQLGKEYDLQERERRKVIKEVYPKGVKWEIMEYETKINAVGSWRFQQGCSETRVPFLLYLGKVGVLMARTAKGGVTLPMFPSCSPFCMGFFSL